MPPPCQKSDALSCFGYLSRDMTRPYSDDTHQCLPEHLFDRCRYGDARSCQARSGCTWHNDAQLCTPRPTPEDLGAFKTPSLRNVARTWPYMHNGALADFGPAERGEVPPDDATPHLLKVVEFYNQGGGRPEVGTLDPLLRPLHLTRSEMADLVEFLKSLTDESVGHGPLGQIPADLADVSDCPQ